MAEFDAEWRVLDGVSTAWFDASSLSDGAALTVRILEIAPTALIDVRATGIRVRLAVDEHAPVVSATARELGLNANPAVLQQLTVVLESADPSTVTHFWKNVLDYSLTDGELVDPLQRDPTIRIRESTESRPLRNRIHLDVVRPAPTLQPLDLGEAFGPYGLCHADPDGNEVDLVPGDPLGDSDTTADWQAVFSAMVCYRTTSLTQQSDLVAAVAALADETGFPLLIDIRPELVILDSGKDQSDRDAHGLDIDFIDLATRIQTAARELGAAAEPALSRFVQIFFDAADVDVIRAFWLATLGYLPDRRDGVTDIVDPRRLNPVLVFQQLDSSDTERRQQRNRIHIELTVPSDLIEARVAATLTAGGRLIEHSDVRCRVTDPEGNELTIVRRSVG